MADELKSKLLKKKKPEEEQPMKPAPIQQMSQKAPPPPPPPTVPYKSLEEIERATAEEARQAEQKAKEVEQNISQKYPEQLRRLQQELRAGREEGAKARALSRVAEGLINILGGLYARSQGVGVKPIQVDTDLIDKQLEELEKSVKDEMQLAEREFEAGKTRAAQLRMRKFRLLDKLKDLTADRLRREQEMQFRRNLEALRQQQKAAKGGKLDPELRKKAQSFKQAAEANMKFLSNALKAIEEGDEEGAIREAQKAGISLKALAPDTFFTLGELDDSLAKEVLQKRLQEQSALYKQSVNLLTGGIAPEVEGRVLSEEEQKALEWAKAHPGHPIAQKILQAYGPKEQ